MREPIPEIFEAAHHLDRAVGTHLTGDYAAARDLISRADNPSIREWTESLWGSRAASLDQAEYFRFRECHDAPPHLPEDQRQIVRMPFVNERSRIIDHYGLNCAFCGIPVIRKEIRIAIREVYPDALPWGRTNSTQHSAFQCMWLQFDHLLPHSRGGESSIENVLITCAPCNYGRGNRVIQELGLLDPRERTVWKTSWDGLERFLSP